jgi:hypothetical protein
MKHNIVAIIISMMILNANANAALWLDIVKEFVAGGIKTVVMPKAAKSLTSESKPASTPATSAEAPKSGSRSPEEIYAALDRLNSICGQEFVNYVPCAVGTGKNFDIGKACKEAKANAIVSLAENMETYVESNAEIKDSKDEDPDGVLKVTGTYVAEAKLSTKQLVTGAQQYFCYSYKDEEATEINKGRTVYIATSVVVMNKDLFGKALEDAAKDKPISQQIIKESRKGIVAIAKEVLKGK